MENASKALLIGAGMLFALLIITLLVIFYGQVSSYFEEKNKMTEIEQLEKFNAKFENYHDKQIRGSELVSILNMIVDYNNLQADAQGYEPIKVTIDLKGHQNELKYDNESGGKTLITVSNINNNSNDTQIKKIAETSSRLSVELGIADVKLQKLASRISDIVDEPSDSDEKEEYKKFRKQILERILGYEVPDSEIGDIKTATYQYYQYMQFKRAMFDCKDVTYNTDNGRVNGMAFDVILEADINGELKIKMD